MTDGGDPDPDADADGAVDGDEGGANGVASGPEGLAARRGVETEVYGPAEDSALLARAGIERVSGLALEVGTGSGWVADRVAAETGARVIGSDLNPDACRRARDRGVEAVRADLLGPFRDGAFDAVLFNPPYLPTDPDTEWDDWMETALSGGESGRELIEPFVDSVGRTLAPDGVALLLVSSLAGFEEVVERAERAGFAVETVVEESYPFETLSVLALRLE